MRPEETTLVRTISFSSNPELVKRYRIVDRPISGNFRLGLLLEELDIAAEQAALAYARRVHPDPTVVTAAIDEVVIRNPAEAGCDVTIAARINHVGTSSMEVGLRVTQEVAGAQVHIASCYFTMVARTGSSRTDRGIGLPPLEVAGEQERRRSDKALARKAAYRAALARAEEPPTSEEFQFLRRLHDEQGRAGFAGLTAPELVIVSWERMYHEMEYNRHIIFGGHVVNRAFQLAVIAAEKVVTHRPLLARVNRINFLAPVLIGSVLHLSARAVYSSRHHVTVEVEIEQITRDRTRREPTNTCVFTFRNVDSELQPQPTPFIYPVTCEEEGRFLSAYRQRLD